MCHRTDETWRILIGGFTASKLERSLAGHGQEPPVEVVVQFDYPRPGPSSLNGRCRVS